VPPIGSQPAPPQTASPARTLTFVMLGLAGVLLLGGYLMCGDRSPSSSAAQQAQENASDRLAGLRPMTSGRVPKLRTARPERPPTLVRPAEQPPPPNLTSPKERMAPLVAMYGDFYEATGLDATEMRELRRLLYQAHQWVLKPGPAAGKLLGNNPSAKRTQAMALLQAQLSDTIRPEQVERVMNHSFLQELLSWNEPFFESDARGLVNVRADVMPPEAPGAAHVPESAQ
jgi:hypothetical protein